MLAALTRLKQICNHPAHVLGDGSRLSGRSGKLTRYDELIDELLDVGERALVFTQFREMGELLRRHAAERLQLRVPFLHGGVTRARRDAMVSYVNASIRDQRKSENNDRAGVIVFGRNAEVEIPPVDFNIPLARGRRCCSCH